MARFVELRKSHRDWTMLKVVEKGQDVSPPSRRRPVYPPLVSWASKALTRQSNVVKALRPQDGTRGGAQVSAAEGASSPAWKGDSAVDALIQQGNRAGSSILAEYWLIRRCRTLSPTS